MKFVVVERAVVPRLPEPRGTKLSKIVTAHYRHLKKLQDEGKLVHYSFIGIPGGYNIIEAKNHEELDRMMMELPRFSYCNYEVVPVLTLEEGMACSEFIAKKYQQEEEKAKK